MTMSISDMDVDIDGNTPLPLPLPIMASSDEESLPMAGSQQQQQQLAAGMLRDWSDARLERVASYTTTTMRLKPDKWCKMMANDDFRVSTLSHTHNHTHTHSQTSLHADSASCWTGCTAAVVCSS